MRLLSVKGVALLLAALVALAALGAACGGGDDDRASPSPGAGSPTSAAFPLTITDSNGKQVTLEAPPRRVVALAPSFVEVLFAVGAGEALVAVDQNADYPPEAASIPKISGFEPSIEGIVALEPDLVLIFFDPGDLQSSLEALGIPILYLATPGSIDGVLEQIELLGRAVGRPAEAERLTAEMREGIAALVRELADIEQGPRVFHELDPTLFSTCPGEFTHDMYVTLKAQNVAAGASGFCQVTNEAVIQADPEVIILADEPAGESPETVKARPGWDAISAVKDGRIYVVDPDLVSRPGPRIVEAMAALAALLYPELFP